MTPKAHDLATQFLSEAASLCQTNEFKLTEFADWLIANGKLIDPTECRCRTIRTMRQQQGLKP